MWDIRVNKTKNKRDYKIKPCNICTLRIVTSGIWKFYKIYCIIIKDKIGKPNYLWIKYN